MTDDIVTQLRGYDFMRDGDIPDVIMNKAADEVERLRTELRKQECCQEAAYEIMRLRADCDKWKRLFLEMYEKDGTTNEMMYAYRKEKW